MASPLLDFKKFKHVKSDKHSTTLQHQDGHILNLAHNVLSKPHQEQLKALANIPKETQTEGQKQEAQDQNQYGKVIMKAEGGEISKDIPKPDAKYCMHCGGPIKMAEGGSLASKLWNSLPSSSDEGKEQVKDYGNQLETNNQSSPIFSSSPDQQSSGNPAQPMPPEAQMPGVVPQGGFFGTQQPMPEGASPMANQAAQPEQPQEQQPQAQSATSQPQSSGSSAPIQKAQMEPGLPTDPTTPGEQPQMPPGDEVLSEAQKWSNDLNNGHITPQTYASMFHDKSTLGKIGTIFGMLFSGAGAGLTHGPNMLMEMMNKEIDRDLEAQKASKSNALNFKTLAEQHYRNKVEAGHYQATDALSRDALMKVQADRAAFKYMSDMADKIQDPVEKQKALEKLGMVSNSMDQNHINMKDALNAKSALLSGIQGDQGGNNSEQAFQSQQQKLRLSGYTDMAKNNEAKHFPGLPGHSSEDMDPDTRKSIEGGMQFDKQLHTFMDWAKNHSGKMNLADVNTGTAMAAELQGAYRQATHGGVYKEGEQNFIGKIIKEDPTEFFNKVRVMPQLEALAKSHKDRMNTLVKAQGFPGYPGAGGSAQQTPQYKVVGGVKYMRGPNGEAIPVK